MGSWDYVFKVILPLITCLCLVAAIRNSIYIISETETPSLCLDGLTPVGFKSGDRVHPQRFAPPNIGLIIACAPDPATGACYASVATATPFANSLNLTVNTNCRVTEDAEDDCLPTLVDDWAANTKAIVMVWDNAQQDSLFENLAIEAPGDDLEDFGVYHDATTTIRNEQWIGQLPRIVRTLTGRCLVLAFSADQVVVEGKG